MSVKADLLALAAELEADRPDLAARLKTIAAKIGRPKDPEHLARLLRVREKMMERIENGEAREKVLDSVVRRHGQTPEFWWRVYKREGRPDLR